MNRKQILLSTMLLGLIPSLSYSQKNVEYRQQNGNVLRADEGSVKLNNHSKNKASIAAKDQESIKRDLSLKNPNEVYAINPNGLEYLFVVDQPGVNAKAGDIVSVNVIFMLGDTTLINTRQVYNGKPETMELKNPSFPGELTEGIMMMSVGDSAHFRMPITMLEQKTGMTKPAYVTADQYASWKIKLENIETKEQFEQRKKLEQASLIGIQNDEIETLLKSKKLKYTKTSSGAYVVMHKDGTGSLPTEGKEVFVNYTGKLMNGTAFDSNVDPKFNHVEPLSFPLGKGRVIKGWDEGVATMKKGSKATLYIPAHLAYGERSPSPLIPANSILIFDIDLLDFK